MSFAPSRTLPNVITVKPWAECDEQMRSAWHFLRTQKIVHGPFNRSQLIREAIKTVLIARDQVKAGKAKIA